MNFVGNLVGLAKHRLSSFNNAEEKVHFAKADETNMDIRMEENGFSVHPCSSKNTSPENTSSFSQKKARRDTITGLEKPTITAWDAGYNVSNAIQGMFVLGLPYAVLHGGYIGLGLIITAAVACYYTGNILIDCLYENVDDYKTRIRGTYVDVAVECWGIIGGHVVNAAQLIELLMTCVLYIVISGNLMESSFPDAVIGESGWAVIATIFLFPCIFLHDLRAVSWLSMGCSIAQVVVLAITMLYCFTEFSTWKWAELTFEVDSREFPVSIGVIVFSYTSQIFLPSLEGSMENRGEFKGMLLWSYVASCLMKVMFSLVCFLTWGKLTKDVVTDNLPQGLRAAVNTMLVVKALLSYPLPYYLSLELIEQSFFTNATGGWGSLLRTKRQPYGTLLEENVPIKQSTSFMEAKSSPTDDVNGSDSRRQSVVDTIITLDEENNGKNHNGFPACYSSSGDLQLWAMVLRGVLVLGTLIMAVFIPHFALLMGLTGSLTGTSLAFLLPCAFHLQIKWKELSRVQVLVDVGLLVSGVLCLITGIYFSIVGLYDSYNPSSQDYLYYENMTSYNTTKFKNEDFYNREWFPDPS